MIRLGLLTDTHQPLDQREPWAEVYSAFAGVDYVLHGGDIVHPMVLDWLEEIAPVLAARGNNDVGWHDPRVKDVQWLDLEGVRLAMLHDMEPEDRPIDVLKHRYLGGQHADIIVTGDTHYERMDFREGVLQINSGSPTLPHHYSTRLGTVGLVTIDAGVVEAKIVRLGETPGKRNPGIEFTYTAATGVQRLG